MTNTPDNPLLGRHPNHPLPTLEWPGENPPRYWWGLDKQGNPVKVFRDYEAYCDG